MKRYTITLGATTTAGGKVVFASSNGSINRAPIALEGDLIICPACKSQGKIKCVGPRIPELWNGKTVALENDLCLCGCPSPPRLVSNQTLRYQNLSDFSEDEAAVFPATLAKPGPYSTFDDKFVLFDEETDQPIPNTEYAIRRENGNLEYGVTDQRGQTHLLAATVATESVDIYA
ncbi:PAAR domain-containing protein [Duganella fentianensis]|uniref:PAAR domain-containing protein n=1 Tax=Duganella fentianensis TaxID=2692177 RepID=UPI0032B19C98